MPSELSRDEKALLFDQFVEAAPDILWMFSADWEELIFQSGGYEELWGRPSAALEENPTEFLEGIHPEDRSAVREKMEAVADGVVAEVEYRVNPGENYQRWAWSYGKPIRDDGEVVRIAGFTREVTTRKAQQRELQRQNDRLEEFSEVLAHDLRNPLNVADMRLELVRDECESDHIGAIERAHDRIDTLLETLLTIAREGEAVEEREPVALEATVETCRGTVETAEATFEIDTEQVIEADESRLQQLFENLFRNAIEHGGDDVTIRIGDLEDGFYVEDDGPGIPAGDHEDVFESGYTTASDGLGFGLTIVREIAQAHGWSVDVTDSEAGGTRFEVTGVTSRH